MEKTCKTWREFILLSLCKHKLSLLTSSELNSTGKINNDAGCFRYNNVTSADLCLRDATRSFISGLTTWSYTLLEIELGEAFGIATQMPNC